MDGGKGNHVKILWPPTQKSVTVSDDLQKDVLYYLLGEIENISLITWGQIKKKL